MGQSPRLASDEDDDEDTSQEQEPEPTETSAAAPSVGHPYRAPAVRDGDRPRKKKRRSILTSVVAATGGAAALGVMYVLTRVPIQAPEPVVTESPPVAVPAIPTQVSQVIRETPAPATMIARQAEEMEIAMAFERKDDERIVSMLLPQLSTTSCTRLRILQNSCGRLRRWSCARAAYAELTADGCR